MREVGLSLDLEIRCARALSHDAFWTAFFAIQRTAWFPPIEDSAISEAAEAEALQSLSHEQAAILQAEKKQRVLAQLRQRVAKMNGKLCIVHHQF